VFIGLVLLDRDHPRLPRHYSPEEHRGVEILDLLALRRHHVVSRVHDGSRALNRAWPRSQHNMLNPLRSEDEAFRFLLYAFVVIAVIVGLVLALRAIL